jgi:hypothetical protein
MDADPRKPKTPADLQPFNEFAVCAQCEKIRGPETKPLVKWCDGCEHFGDFPHLHRQCDRCSFVWAELTALLSPRCDTCGQIVRTVPAETPA